jgi:hypothetical protein
MRKIADFILDTLTIAISLIFFIVSIPQMLFLVLPSVSSFAQVVLITPDPRHSFIVWTGSLVALSLAKKYVNKAYCLIDTHIIDTYHFLFIFLSFIITFFLVISYSAVEKFVFIAFLLLPIFLYIVLALIMSQLSYINSRILLVFTKQKNGNLKYWELHKYRYIITAITFWIVVPGSLFFTYKIASPSIRSLILPYVQQIILYKRSPFLKSVTPHIAYPSSTIIIRGNNFGWLQNKQDAHNKVFMGDLVLYPDSWTDKEITVTLPLQLKPSKYKVFLVTRVEYNGKIHNVQSNEVIVQILSRTDGGDDEDDLYFQQINRMSSVGDKLNN